MTNGRCISGNYINHRVSMSSKCKTYEYSTLVMFSSFKIGFTNLQELVVNIQLNQLTQCWQITTKNISVLLYIEKCTMYILVLVHAHTCSSRF